MSQLRCILLMAFAAVLLSEVAAFAPTCLVGVSSKTSKIMKGIFRPRDNVAGKARAGLKMSAEPSWEEESDDDKITFSPPKKEVKASGSATSTSSGWQDSRSSTRDTELKPTLQELAERAREKAADQMWGSSSSTTVWKQNLARRMEEASSSDVFKLPLPGFNMESVGLKGNWREVGGSFVLDPPVPPIGVAHFLGGAFVGAAPHIAYRFLLELLADEGFVVVATPFRLTFNYLDVCAEIEVKAREALEEAVSTHGPLPVISVGHSAGSLLHVLLSTLFPGKPRDAAVLISYNNMQAKNSIPQLDEIVSPASEFLVREGDPVKRLFQDVRSRVEDLTTDLATSGFAPRAFGSEFLSLAADGFEIAEQIPGLMTDIAGGIKEFSPAAEDIKDLIRQSYPMPHTLVIGFEKDGYDESDVLKGLLRDGGLEFEEASLEGNHYTPLTPDPLISTPLDSFDPLLPLRRQVRQKLIEPLGRLTNVVTPFMIKHV